MIRQPVRGPAPSVRNAPAMSRGRFAFKWARFKQARRPARRALPQRDNFIRLVNPPPIPLNSEE